MFGLLDYLKIGAGVIVGAILSGFIAHGLGVRDGKKEASIDALAVTVKHYQDKGQINAEVSVVDAASLCVDYGLPDDELSECVRRVREASAKSGNVSAHPDD
ncbi:hypothetical protein ACJKIH_02935 [Brucella pseudogrignonensis]|uniref:hypothetical protein n=1 Tax=Brucella pseudogrignonensis TaxID=419475 RepID=UPI0038B43627